MEKLKMKKKKKRKEMWKMMDREWKWIIHTFLFVLATLVVFVITLWNPFWALFLLLFLFLTIFVGSVLKAFFSPKDELNSEKLVVLYDKNISENQKLLRYATAILAFLSLMTTASGMNSYVFSESWMAYLGSFAVQSILVSFSLLLCKFFVQISMLNWQLYIKRIVNGLMIAFFAISLLVSSTFSFSYIANNAYKDSWPSDSEAIIQAFLFEETNNLRIENERCGKIILDAINQNAYKNIEAAINKSKNIKLEKWKSEITEIINEIPDKRLKTGKADIDRAKLLRMFPQYESHIDFLSKEYKAYSKEYDQFISLYNRITKQIKESNYEDILDRASGWITKIDNACNNMENKKKSIIKLKTSQFNIDFSSVRTKYINAADALISDFIYIREITGRINDISKQIDENSKTKSTDELDKLMSDIYMLGTDKKIQVKDLVQKISDLVISTYEDEDYTSQEIKKITSLKDALSLYADYIELKDNLSKFAKDRVQQIYFISSGKKSNDTKISYPVWKEKRNEDFNSFAQYVKSLPNMSIHNIKELNNEQYRAEEVLEKLSVYQRDLLGDLTEFEQAFNYFKYKFSVMAYFSAFIAVFFDLGSFFTGCFLYAVEYLKKNIDDEILD